MATVPDGLAIHEHVSLLGADVAMQFAAACRGLRENRRRLEERRKTTLPLQGPALFASFAISFPGYRLVSQPHGGERWRVGEQGLGGPATPLSSRSGPPGSARASNIS